MTPTEAQAYLQSFINYEIDFKQMDRTSFKLDRVHELLRLLGNPEKKLKFLHVAGSKGKGSTCVFAAHILSHAGYRVGLYTSPHLYDYSERIRILDPFEERTQLDVFCGKISELELAEVLSEMQYSVEQMRNNAALGRLTFFEVFTVLAIYYFYKEKVDFAVMEVGLGGRLDATNVIDADVSAITSISLEHTQFLGNSLSAIAREKAAIIKRSGQPVIVAPQEEEALAEVKDQCDRMKARVLYVNQDIKSEIIRSRTTGTEFNVFTPHAEYLRLNIPLLGGHQVTNAAVAVGMAEALAKEGFNLTPKAVAAGLQNTFWPGRLEILQPGPVIILDGAHNPASAALLAKNIRDIFPDQPVRLIFGVSDDKDWTGMIKELNKIADRIIFTRADHPRACHLTLKELSSLFDRKNIQMTESVREAVDIIQKSSTKDQVNLITGSLFVVGEARKLCTS